MRLTVSLWSISFNNFTDLLLTHFYDLWLLIFMITQAVGLIFDYEDYLLVKIKHILVKTLTSSENYSSAKICVFLGMWHEDALHTLQHPQTY